jgi:hypothetical protein
MSIERPIIRESGKWYSRDGVPVNEVQSADGKKQVRPTVTHARKFGYLPSVTSIVRQLDKPGLRTWRDQQVILAALSMPRKPDQIDEQWVKDIIEDAEAQVEAAADRGKDWHAIIEQALLGQTRGELSEVENAVVKQVRDWLAQELGEGYSVVVERTVKGDGFAGTPDIIAQNRDLTKTILADIKTVKDDAPVLGKGKPFEEWLYQIAAYWRTTDAEYTNCWEVCVGRENGAVRFHRWSAEEIKTGWRAFSLLRQLWCIRNSYDPLTWTGKGKTQEV